MSIEKCLHDYPSSPIGPCPPAFLLELSMFRPDELLFAHIARCRSCAAAYERWMPTPGLDMPTRAQRDRYSRVVELKYAR